MQMRESEPGEYFVRRSKQLAAPWEYEGVSLQTACCWRCPDWSSCSSLPPRRSGFGLEPLLPGHTSYHFRLFYICIYIHKEISGASSEHPGSARQTVLFSSALQRIATITSKCQIIMGRQPTASWVLIVPNEFMSEAAAVTPHSLSSGKVVGSFSQTIEACIWKCLK